MGGDDSVKTYVISKIRKRFFLQIVLHKSSLFHVSKKGTLSSQTNHFRKTGLVLYLSDHLRLSGTVFSDQHYFLRSRVLKYTHSTSLERGPLL